MKKKTYLFNSTLAAVLFAAALTVGSCAESNDLDSRKSPGDKGAAVRFDVKDVQESVLSDQGSNLPGSRSADGASFNDRLSELGLLPSDLEPQVLEAQTPAGMEACLVETTIPGINPVQPDPQTRATVTKTLTADFSTLGYRATSMTAVSPTPDWFYNARTKSNGELYDELYWNWSGNRFGRFYAVFPEVKATYPKLKLSPSNHSGNPYVEFEVEANVADQKDLMTACSGVVEYQTQGVAPNTSLVFRHALTAIHFTVGQNLWAGKIDKIEISGAISQGTYTLSSDPGQPGTWALGTTTGTCTLSGININTATNPGTVITDDNGNYTFFMIPQQVTGKNINVDIHFQDGKTIHVPLKGTWTAGTTKTYTLSNKQSNWDYQFEVRGQNNTAAYDATSAGTYIVYSSRYVRYSSYIPYTRVPIAWKVVSYQESADGGLTWGAETTEKPDWLDLSLTEGTGGTSGQQGTVTVKKAPVIDKAAERNARLKLNHKGDATNYYDLSTHNLDGTPRTRSTANSYVISHPGFYKIPLVYGNAIKDGNTNLTSYKPNITVTNNENFLKNFKDHAGKDITDPWIEKTNSGANNGIDGAKLVWSDETNLVHNIAISRDASGDAYLQFEVKAADIKMGNAVVAVTKNNVVVWSWHLWFTSDDVLNTTEVTNFQNVKYNFTQENLGWKYTQWLETAYTKPRQVKVKLLQTSGNAPKKTAYITITQTPYSAKQGYGTFYQWGRKDAFPGIAVTPDGFKPVEGYLYNYSTFRPLERMIQDPGTLWRYNYWDHYFPNYNLWATNCTGSGFYDPIVVKTIYDPCPVGFHMPASNAFTGFTKNGENITIAQFARANVSGDWDFGWHFNNKITDPDATLWFPATGAWAAKGPELGAIGARGYYWTAITNDIISGNGCSLYFYGRPMEPKSKQNLTNGFAVRPVAE